MTTRASGVLLLLMAGCGGAKSQPSRTPLSVEVGPAGAEQTEEAAKPPRVALDGVRITVQNPKRDLPKLSGFVPDPSVAQLLFEPRLALPSALGEAAARAVDLSRPMGLALNLGDTPPIAMAFFVNEAEGRALHGRRVAAGRVRLEPADDARLGSCELWQLGAAGERLICGTTDDALNALAPVLLQAEPLPSSAALRLDVAGPTYRNLLGTRALAQAEKKAGAETGGERLGRRLAEAVILHDRLSIELSLLPDGMELALSLGYDDAARSPLFSAWLAGSLAPPPLPPAGPRGEQSGFWVGSAGSAPSAFAPLKQQLLAAFAEEQAATSYATPAQIEQARAVLSALVPDTARFSFASGENVEAAQSVLDQSDKPKAGAAERQKLERALGSWCLIGVEQPPAQFIAAVKTGLKLGKIREKPTTGKKPEQHATKSESRIAATTPKDLPPGTLHVIESVRPNPKFVPSAEHPREDAHVEHLLIVPDGAHVWIAIARSEQVAIAAVRGALVHTKEVVLPAADIRQPLFAVRMTPAGLVGLGATFDNAEETRAARGAISVVTLLPRHGRSELLVFGEARRAPEVGRQSFDLRLSARLSNDAASEWLAWALAAADTRKAGGAHSE